MTRTKLSDRHLVVTLTLTFSVVCRQSFPRLQPKPQQLELFNSIAQNLTEKLIYNQPADDNGVPSDREKGGGDKSDNCQKIDAIFTFAQTFSNNRVIIDAD